MLYAFDMDDTLIHGFLSDKDSPKPYAHVELLPNRMHIISSLVVQDPRASFAIVTNQGGVAFGFNTMEEVRTKIGKVLEELKFFMSRPVSIHVCYMHPEATEMGFKGITDRRKPGPGMLYEAMEAHRVTYRDTVYIGDLETDRQAAAAADIPYKDANEFFTLHSDG